MVPNYKEMRQIALERAEKAGMPVGTKIRFRKRTGVIADVNPLFYDMTPMKVYVHLEEGEKFKAKKHELLSIDDLSPCAA